MLLVLLALLRLMVSICDWRFTTSPCTCAIALACASSKALIDVMFVSIVVYDTMRESILFEIESIFVVAVMSDPEKMLSFCTISFTADTRYGMKLI